MRVAVVRKEDGGYCVRSEKNSDWNGGCYPTKAEADKRLSEVEYFKNKSATSRTHRVVFRWLMQS